MYFNHFHSRYFNGLTIPQFIYPFYCWWIFRLFLAFSYFGYHCYEHYCGIYLCIFYISIHLSVYPSKSVGYIWRAEFLGYRLCVCSTLIDTAKQFSNVVVTLSLFFLFKNLENGLFENWFWPFQEIIWPYTPLTRW